MPEYSNYLESRTPLTDEEVEGDEILGCSKDGSARSLTSQQIANLGGGGSGVVESIVAGTNITVDDTDPANPIISASGGGGSGTVESVTGDGVDNTDPDNPVLTFPDASEVEFTPAGNIAATDVQAAIGELDSEKVDKETFATLTFASPTVWNCNNRQNPLAKVTATGNFTIDMTNVKSGSQGVLRITKNTASDITLTFDTDFTNKQLNETLLTYTFSGSTANEYYLSFVCDGTNLEWVIGDIFSNLPTVVIAKVSRSSAVSILDNTYSIVSWQTEVFDNGGLVDLGTDATKINIPGSGDKLATITVQFRYAANVTGVRRIRLYVNGSDANFEYFVSVAAAQGGGETFVRSTFKVICSGGDYIQAVAYHNAGTTINLVEGSTTLVAEVEDI